MGIKERKTKILIALVLMGDTEMNPVHFTDIVQKTFDVSLNPKTKATLKSMEGKGFIEKVITETSERTKSKEVVYKLTTNGYNELCLDFAFFRYLTGEWDGKWRILSYEIPEKKREMRDRLRREVAGWGLGPWHRSFWITPHPVITHLQDFVSNKEEEKYIQAFESSHAFGNRDVLIEKVWGTKDLEQQYKKLFKKWHDILSSDKDKPAKFKQVISDYISVLRDDPGLPAQLVGSNWIGFESYKIYKEVRNILLS